MNKKIETILQSSRIPFKEIRHDSLSIEINSPMDFAQALNYQIERITKSVFLKSKGDTKYVMAVCSSNKKLNFPKIASLTSSKKIEVANREELAEIVGYPPTGVCPIGINIEIPIYIDTSVFKLKSILIGSGEVGVEIEIKPKDLLKIITALVEDISL